MTGTCLPASLPTSRCPPCSHCSCCCRGGLVGPWTAVAPLMALCTDPHEEIRGRALRLLRTLCDKYPRYLDADRLCSGVVEAFNFRWALVQVGGRVGG